MAEKDVLLFEVMFDAKEADDNVAKLKTSLAELRAEKAKVEKEFKAGTVSAADYGKSMAAIDKQSSSLSRELREQNKAIRDNTQIQKSAEGSLVQLRAQLSAMTTEYGKLSKAERENANTGGKLQEQIRGLSDELKENEKALGDNRRNVGNYVRDVNVMGINVGQVADTFADGANGVQVFAKSIFTTRGALIALTALPILLFLAGLVAFFKSTDEGADKLEQGIAALSAGFDAVMKTIAPLGKLLVDTFLNPLDALKKFGAALLSPIDSIKAIANGSRKMADDIATNFSTAAQAAVTYTRQMQNIEDAENNLIAQRARVGLQVDQALLKVKDRNLSEKERIQILQQAGVAEAALAKQQLIIARDRLAASLQQNMAIQRSRKLTDDEIKKQLEAEAALINAKRESLNTQQAITNRMSALKEQEDASDKEQSNRAKERAKAAAQDRVYIAELELLGAKARGVETLSYQENLLRKQSELETTGLSKGSAQRKLIEAKTNAEVLALRVDHAQKLESLSFDDSGNELSARLRLVQKNSDAEFELQKELLKNNLDKQKAEAVNAAQKDVALRKGLNKLLRKLDADFNADTEALARQHSANVINLNAELDKLELQGELDTSEDFLSIRRNQAADVIKIEKAQQLALLEIMDISAEEKKVREYAINGAAAARTKEVYRQIQADERKDRIAKIETQLSYVTAGSRAELVLRLKLMKEQATEELASVELSEDQKNAIRAKYNRASLDAQKEHSQKIADFTLDSLSKSTSVISSLIESQITRQTNALQQQQDSIIKSAGLTGEARTKIEEQFEKKKAKLEREAAERRRKIATVENIITTARSINSALATGFDPITKAAGVVLAIATGVATQITISSQKFAMGGVARTGNSGPVFGPSHQQGGIQMYGRNKAYFGEMEGDEIILTKGVYRNPNLRAKASELNVAGGGVAFAPQTPRPLYAALGGVAGYAYQQAAGSDGGISYSEMQRVFDNSVAKMPRQVLVVQDVQSGIGRAVRVVERADA